MRRLFVMLCALLAGESGAIAADIEAGKAKVATVCAACHGALGTSVSDTIPNLAGQKGKYIEIQLKALRDGTRKNQIMGAIAMQLSDADIANVAVYFSSLPGAASMAKSDFLPNLAKTGVTFPENYQATYTKYHTINFPDNKQVRY
jgi:cytochrome c553